MEKHRPERWRDFVLHRFLPQCWGDLKASVGEQVVGVVLAILILLAQIRYGVISQDAVRANVLAVLWPYAALIGLFVIYHVVRAPWLISNAQLDEIAILKTDLNKATWLPNRPKLSFARWGQIPAHDPRARQIDPRVVGQFLQNGFHLLNDGDPAYEVTVEPFKFGAFTARSSETVARIGKEGGFVMIQVDQLQSLQSSHSPGRWDLQGAIAIESAHANKAAVYERDYTVMVRIEYRDANNVWYHSEAEMRFIPSQQRLDFGHPTQLKGRCPKLPS